MTDKWKKPIMSVAAGLLTVMAFAIDSIPRLNGLPSILYLVVLVLMARAWSGRGVIVGAVVCAALTIIAWASANAGEASFPSAAQVVFACISIIMTGAFLKSREVLKCARQELDRSRAEVEFFANSVPHILWRANARGEVQYFNARVTEVTGLDPITALDGQSYMGALHPDDLPSVAQAVGDAVANQTVSSIYARLRHVDGNYRWMHLYDQPVLSPITGEVERYGGASDVHEEIEGKRQLLALRKELEESREELQNFTDSVPQILWRATAEAHVDFYNKRYTEIIGRDFRETIERQDWIADVHPEDRETFLEKIRSSFGASLELRHKYRLRHADGTYRWMSIIGRPKTSQGGELLRYYGGTTDVHDDVMAQEELHKLRLELEETRRDMENLADSIPQILWRATRHAHVDYYNKRYDEITGRNRYDTIARQDWIEDFHPDDHEWYLERVRIAFEEGTELRAVFRMRYADGEYRWMSLVGRPVRSEGGEVLRYYGGVSDVHEDVLAREELLRLRSELERSRAELQNFTDSVPQILWRAKPDGPVEYFNRRHTDLTGQSVADAIENQGWLKTIHPEDRDRVLSSLIASRGGENDLHCNYRMLRVDGTYRWMSVYARPAFSSDGVMLGRYGGAVDIHDEMVANEKIRDLNETLEQRVEERTAKLLRTEARYAGLFDVSNMTFAEMDFSATEPALEKLRAQGVVDLRSYLGENPDVFAELLSLIRTTRVNEALARMMGYANVAELVANPPAQNADDGPQVLLRQLEMYYFGIDHINGRTVLTGKGGLRIPVYYTVNRMDDGLHLSSHVNLTEQERIDELHVAAKEELARANRVATVGAFSASIAHELNQPIASMVMDAQTGLRWIQREEPDIASAQRILERLSKTAQRVAGIVKRTRDSIVAGRRVVKPVDLGALATETRDLLERDMRREGILFEIERGDELPLVLGDPVDLQQVFVNLANNAADAMRGKDGEKRIELSIKNVQDGVCVEVADTGPGIPEGDIERLFQPFFTTKPTGIGMGLQICRSAVEALGGELTARNRPEGGAVFTFSLPLASASAAV